MRWVDKLWLRLRSLFRRPEVEAALDDELRFHFEQQIMENLAAGMAPEEARYAACRSVGGLAQIKEECRDMRRVNWIQDLAQDFCNGWRILRKNPGFTAVAILTLAIGIGANTAVFSVLESQLWRPLPFSDSERLVEVYTVLRQNPRNWDVVSERVFRAWREQSRSFTSLAGYLDPEARNLRANGASERVPVMAAMPQLFNTFKVSVVRGRSFLPEDDRPGHDHVAILSGSLWRERFGSDPTLLGKRITLDGEAYMVVGITSPELRFEYMHEPAIFVPLTENPSLAVLRGMDLIGRLASGVTRERAREELELILQREMKADGDRREDVAEVSNLRELRTGYAARSLYFFGGAVALVLLIACVNTAGLLLARGLARQREFAVRAALGAGRGRLMRQLLVESLMLAAAGGAGGAIAGVWLARWFAVVLEDTLPRHTPLTLDVRVLLFTVAVSAASAVLAGFAPAALSSRADLNGAFRQNAPGRTASRSHQRARGSLVAVEVALGVVLLFGAGLFLSSFVHLQEAPRGFEAPGSLTFRVALRGERYAKPERMQRYFEGLTEQLRALPGVRAVTLGSGLPLTGSESVYATVKVAGRPPVRPHGFFVIVHALAPNYFQVLHMHLLAGRAFNRGDREASTRVAIINRNTARDLFGSENPIGKVIEFVPDERRGVTGDAPVQIIGVVENAQEFGADEVPFDDLYVPFAQHPLASAYVLVASDLPGSLAGAIRATAYTLDKEQPIFDLKTMDDRVADSLQGARANVFLLGVVAVVGLILVSVGTFGTVAYFVQQRIPEFGIRLALGATSARILQHAIAQSFRIAVAGMSLGVAASLILGRLLRHALYMVPHEHTGMLYGVDIYDPFVLSSACALLFAVLVLGSYIPARRASRVDPVVALRYE
jgi:predicted permease